jgi:manganese transport protein
VLFVKEQRVTVRSRPPKTTRRSAAMIGAAFAVGIGYMDPGNWATDLDAARFGDALLWAVLLSGIGAVLLQLLVVRHTAATGEDLARSIVRAWPQAAPWLWPAYATAVVATEIAEFTGVVVGIALVTHVAWHVAIAAAIALFLALLYAGGTTARRFERFAILTTALLAAAYAIDCALLRPALGPIAAGALTPRLPGPGALVAVVGIVGATIMPHNLFLHGGLVAARLRGTSAEGARRIERRAITDTFVALAIATGVNGAILIVGGAAGATTIERAFATLVPVAGAGSALLFGVALIAAGLAATGSGVCAADVIFHDGAPMRLNALQRRALALVPAAGALAFGVSPTLLLIASQVALALVLPAVVVPLIALVVRGAVHRTRSGLLLLASSSTVVAAALVCDGVMITSLLHA